MPDFREKRLLIPIYAFLYVLRHKGKAKDVTTNKKFWQRGVYSGPSLDVPGAVRVAVLTKGQIKIITSTKIKCISYGGDVNNYDTVNKYPKNSLTDATLDAEFNHC